MDAHWSLHRSRGSSASGRGHRRIVSLRGIVGSAHYRVVRLSVFASPRARDYCRSETGQRLGQRQSQRQGQRQSQRQGQRQSQRQGQRQRQRQGQRQCQRQGQRQGQRLGQRQSQRQGQRQCQRLGQRLWRT